MQRIINKLKEYSLIILITLALLIIISYYWFKLLVPGYFTANESGFRELFGFGLTILGSGIFLAVLKWFQFMGFFRTEIQNIISSSEFEKKLNSTFYEVLHSDEFLSKQKDLEILWQRVNRALFSTQFPERLARQAEERMKTLFFHNSRLSHYFKNLHYTVNIDIDANDFLTFQITLESKVVRPDTSSFSFDLEYYILKHGGVTDTTSDVRFQQIVIDNKTYDLSTDIKTVVDDAITRRKKFETELKGKTEYEVNVSLVLVYNIQTDFEFQHCFEQFVDYLRIECTYPPALRVLFYPLRNEAFETVRVSGTGFVKKYVDLLLPENGFRMLLIK